MRKTNYILIALTLMLFFGCSTEKDKTLNRFYHNTTAYYNGFFNAREILKEIKKDYSKNVAEDYSQLITVNRHPNEEESKSYFPELNRSIDKTTTVINKHAMPNEKVGRNARKEYGKWIDENWLMMGISYFYKREYSKAIEIFDYVSKMYEKDENKYYAKLWLAKTYVEMEQFPKAIKYLKEIEVERESYGRKLKQEKKRKDRIKRNKKRKSKNKRRKTKKRSRVKVTKKREKKKAARSFLVKFPKKMKGDYFATLADYNLRKGNYKEAINVLDSAKKFCKSRKLRVRYSFIQAQLNQKLGQKSQATELYSFVIKKNSDYQMDFYSKINRALIASNKNRSGLKKELKKLAKDEKYIEFRDQIYYALADLDLQEDKVESGISYLEKSAHVPPSNKEQKGKTFLRLADIYFDRKEYVPAQKYYDSTLQELDKNSEQYVSLKEKNQSLTNLVGFINTIQLQDSLIKIGVLPEKKRRDRAEEILYNDKIAKINKEQNSNNGSGLDNPTSVSGYSKKGSFWIYNAEVKNQGIKSFKSVWGTIELEDNWRRSNKNQEGGKASEELEDNSPLVADNEIDEFLKNIPTTEEELENARISIINANYLSGIIYQNQLKNISEAIKSHKDNKKRFHPNPRITPSLYQLYLIYQEIGRTKDIKATKKYILEKYPESKEAKIIQNPSYASEVNKGKDKFEKGYLEAYTLLASGKNTEAITKIESLLKDKTSNPYECKLLFLKAKAYSNQMKTKELEDALAKVVEKCSGSELGQLAQSTLGKLRNKEIKKEESKKTIYKYEPNAIHYFVVVVPVSESQSKLKIALSNFNNASFKENKLKVNAIGIDKKNQTILVKQFSSKQEAHSYYVAFKVNPIMREFTAKYKYFTISQKNYSTLFITKDIKEYETFFNSKYF